MEALDQAATVLPGEDVHGEPESGGDYGRLHRCVSIAILDYDLTGQAGCHTEYRLRDRGGNGLTELFEIHITGPGKALQGTAAVNGWIRLFNTGRGENPEIITAKNRGIREAMEALREMGLSRSLRYWHETNLKLKRNRNSGDGHVRDCGIAEEWKGE